MESLNNGQQVFTNKTLVDLMIWETNPAERNSNNVIAFCLDKKNDIKPNDLIVGDYNEYFVSVYKIVDIIEKRQASVYSKNYIKAQTEWSQKSPSFFKGKDLQQTNLTFQKLVGI